MEKKPRTFCKLKKEKSLEELNHFAKEVTERYATSTHEYSQKNVAMDNNLTKHGLRDLMDYAIKYPLVSLEIADKVLYKAMKNQQGKGEIAGGTSINHHKDLIRIRNKNLLGSYLDSEVKRIAEDVASNPLMSTSYFTEKYEIESDTLTKKILERAIEENIVSDEVMERIIQRSLKLKDTPKVRKYFENLKEKRQAYKSSQ